MAVDPKYRDPGQNIMAGSMRPDGNVRGLIVDMLCIRGGDKHEAQIISKACVLDCGITNDRPPDDIPCDCFMLSVERHMQMRGIELPHQQCAIPGDEMPVALE